MGTSFAHIMVSSKRLRDDAGNPLVVLGLKDVDGDNAMIVLNRDAAQAVAATLMRAAVVQTEDELSITQKTEDHTPPSGDNVIKFKH